MFKFDSCTVCFFEKGDLNCSIFAQRVAVSFESKNFD